MNNFAYCSPTKFIFGKGEENNVGQYMKELGSKKGFDRVRRPERGKSGLLGRVRESLKKADVAYVELGGVQPNPRYELALEGMDIVKKRMWTCCWLWAAVAWRILPRIAVGVYDDGDAWEDFYVGNKEVKKAMPVSCILTIAAAGSEGSNSSVITYKGIKGDLGCELIRPVLSIMNPELTMTLPAYQTACGVSDILRISSNGILPIPKK